MHPDRSGTKNHTNWTYSAPPHFFKNSSIGIDLEGQFVCRRQRAGSALIQWPAAFSTPTTSQFVSSPRVMPWAFSQRENATDLLLGILRQRFPLLTIIALFCEKYMAWSLPSRFRRPSFWMSFCGISMKGSGSRMTFFLGIVLRMSISRLLSH